MEAAFTVLVLYTQLFVATAAGTSVGLRWTKDEVAQGFAWDEDIVVFGIPDHDGECVVQVDTNQATNVEPVAEDALWAVAVPFTATGATVSVGSITVARELPIVPGRYQLIFQARPTQAQHAYKLQMTFRLHGSPGFAILKRGELGSDRVLRRKAERT